MIEYGYEDKYRGQVLDLVDSFKYELCHECHLDLSGHVISPDPLGNAHAWCRTNGDVTIGGIEDGDIPPEDPIDLHDDPIDAQDEWPDHSPEPYWPDRETAEDPDEWREMMRDRETEAHFEGEAP